MSDTKYSISGTVVRISPVETRGKYSTRRLVLDTTTNPKWPNVVELEFFGDKGIALLAEKNVGDGDGVTCEFFLKGREWNGPNGVKVFVALSAQSIAVTNAAQRSAPDSSGSAWGTGDPNGPDNDIQF